MRCEEFQSNVDGLARGALSDARTRDAAAAHEESCDACAARLADERSLTAGLHALAASMSDASAPARAEAALLSAFRSRAAAAASVEGVGVAVAVSTSHASSNVVSLSEHAGAKQLSWVKTVAVAAMAAAAAVALFMLVPPFSSGPVPPKESAAKSTKSTQSAPVQTRNSASAASAGRDATAFEGEERHALASEGVNSAGRKATDESVAQGASSPRRNVVRGAMNAASYGGSSRGVASNRGASASDSGEITTEFIQLAGFAQSEGVHLVRVELPRSALTSFGIPVNADRAGERVKADVLLGEDGTARAIRFVR
ncbi:MAG TPA: hypothetical protein VM914_13485 [Pyrinomonadaceae bacterium]|jgi:hypothetical protein|nr:hypothetical protein [Pyrinomonadaceae bacterium]